MTALELIGLAAAAAAGGAINAVAGGGTLVTFPALLLVGVSPVVANATSTVALVVGTFGSMYGYRRHIRPVRPWLWRFVPVSILGGFLGSLLLTFTSNRTFSKLVPFLIFFATVLFLAHGLFRKLVQREHAEPPASGKKIWAAIVFQFGVAIYGGYFGAGIGILMLASLGFIGLAHIHEMNALKTILGSLINLVAAGWFIYKGLVDWAPAGIMIAGALGGYFLGSHYSQRISQQRVRQIITAIGLILSAVTFYQEFLRAPR
jgi:uncharacterized membrane protein YfcA